MRGSSGRGSSRAWSSPPQRESNLVGALVAAQQQLTRDNALNELLQERTSRSRHRRRRRSRSSSSSSPSRSPPCHRSRRRRRRTPPESPPAPAAPPSVTSPLSNAPQAHDYAAMGRAFAESVRPHLQPVAPPQLPPPPVAHPHPHLHGIPAMAPVPPMAPPPVPPMAPPPVPPMAPPPVPPMAPPPTHGLPAMAPVQHAPPQAPPPPPEDVSEICDAFGITLPPAGLTPSLYRSCLKQHITRSILPPHTGWSRSNSCQPMC